MKTRVISPVGEDWKRARTYALNCWSNLSEDLKVEILSRLPELDLITSKFVCKDWNQFISRVCIPTLSPPNPAAPFYGFLSFEDPPPDLRPGEEERFPDPDPNAHKYLRLKFLPSKNHFQMFMFQFLTSKPTAQDRIVSLLPSAEHDPSDIIDCCNGLLLLAADSQRYFVGNPATTQRIAVPVPLRNQQAQSFHSSLVFDPSVSLSFRIFRYTRAAVDATPGNPLALEIFSSDSGSWSSHVLSLAPQNLYECEWNRRSVYFKGALYYMSKAMYLVCIENVFHMDLNVWAVELPDKDEALHGCIGYSSGCFYYSKRVIRDNSVLIWMLAGKGKNSTWVLKHSISVDLDILSDRNPRDVDRYKKLNSFKPRAFHPTDDMIVMACPRFLIFYYLQTKCVVVAHIPWQYRRRNILVDENWIFPYARSILSLNDIASKNCHRVEKI